MSINYDSNVFKTVTLTKEQVRNMKLAQDKGITYVQNNTSNTATIIQNITGYGSGILSLVFWFSTATSVAFGIIGLAAASAPTRTSVLSLANYGKNYLDSLYAAMLSTNAKSANVKLAYVRVYDQPTNNTILTFVQGGLTNYLTMQDGSIAGQ